MTDEAKSMEMMVDEAMALTDEFMVESPCIECWPYPEELYDKYSAMVLRSQSSKLGEFK
jgi:hypothetical protein